MLDNPPESKEPLTLCSYWFMRSQLDLPIDDGKSFLLGHLGDPKTLSSRGDSGNWPWVAAAALKHWNWVADALEGERTVGLGNREYGSMFYCGAQLAAKIDLLNNAIKLGNPIAPILSSNIKAMLCGAALSALPVSIIQSHQYLHDKIEQVKVTPWYQGVNCTLPAPRQTPDLLTDFVSAILTWAVDFRPRQFKHKWDENNPLTYVVWPMQALQNTFKADFGTTIEAARFALTDNLRNLIKLVWSTAFNTISLKVVLDAIVDWRPAEPITIYRSTTGIASWGPGRSTFKPTILFREVSVGGTGYLCMPQIWKKEAAALGEVLEQGNQIICSADGKSLPMALPDGPLLYKINWGPGRLDVESPGNSIQVSSSGAKVDPPKPIQPTISISDVGWYQRMESRINDIYDIVSKR